MSEPKAHPFLLQTLVSIASACAVVSAYAYLTRAPHPTPARSPASVHMDRKITHIDLRQLSLQDALKQTADAAGVTIKVDPKTNLLHQAIAGNTRVDMELEDVSLRTALESIAWQSSLDMEWRTEPDHVLLTDRAGFSSRVPNVLRAYEVDDLIASGESFAAQFPPPAGSYSPRWATPADYSPRAAAIESLASLLMFLGDQSWTAYGKPPGRAAYTLDRLIVLAPLDGHARIQAVLDSLRRGGDSK